MATSDKIHRSLKAAVDLLNNTFPLFTGKVLDIGPPVMDAKIPTACIASVKADDGSYSFKFRFNPDFAKGLTVGQGAFVMAHEAMHVLRNDPLDMMSPEYPDKRTLNEAMDCIINDSLVNANLGERIPDGCYGRTMLGYDCSKLTTREVYDALLSKGGTDDDSGDGEGDSEACGSHDWSEQDAEASRKHAEQDEDSSPDDSRSGETEMPAGGALVPADVERVRIESILNLLDPDIISGSGSGPRVRSDWTRPRNRHAALWSQGVQIPGKRVTRGVSHLTTKRYQIVVGVDISGSIGDAELSVFRELIRKMTDGYAEFIFVATATGALELDRETLNNLREPGSTVGVRQAVLAQLNREAPGEHPYGLGSGCTVTPSHKDRECRQLHCPASMVAAVKPGSTGSCEADALQCWIMDAVASGRLRKYPRSVLFISDFWTALTLASREEASRWLGLTNEPDMRALEPSTRQNYGLNGSIGRVACRLSHRQIHHLRSFV